MPANLFQAHNELSGADGSEMSRGSRIQTVRNTTKKRNELT